MKSFVFSGVLMLILAASASAQIASFKVEDCGSAVKVTHTDGLNESVEMIRSADVIRIEQFVDKANHAPVVRVIQNGFPASSAEYRFPAGAVDAATDLFQQLSDRVFQK